MSVETPFMSMSSSCGSESNAEPMASDATLEPVVNNNAVFRSFATSPNDSLMGEFQVSATRMMEEFDKITNKNKAVLTGFLNDFFQQQRSILTKSQLIERGAPGRNESQKLHEIHEPPENGKVWSKEPESPHVPHSPPKNGTASLSVAVKKEESCASHITKKKSKKGAHYLFEDSRQMALSDQTRLQYVTDSVYYEWFSGVLIMSNALFIGWQTQYMSELAQDHAALNLPQRQDEPLGFKVFGVLFTILFSVELLLRWVAEGFYPFFQTADLSWNVMDIVIVSFSILDSIIEAAAGASSITGNVSLLRVLRVVRIVRIAKVIRMMPFFRELRMMVFSILGSLKSLLWVLLVLGIVFYVFGIYFTAATLNHLDTSEKWNSKSNELLILCFGTLDRSILTLYMSMTGGQDWGMFYDALLPLHLHHRLIFLLFLSFALFAVVNIVTGVFVEAAMQANTKDRDVIVHEELEHKKTYLESMRAIFEEMDDDGSCCVSLEEFEKRLDDDRVIAYFNHLKLDVSDARTVFHLLDNDNSGEVSIDEFLTGCYKLQGESRNLDTKVMQSQVKYLMEAFDCMVGMLGANGNQPQFRRWSKQIAEPTCSMQTSNAHMQHA